MTEAVVPRGLESRLLDAAGRGLWTQPIQTQVPKGGPVGGCIALAEAACVFAKDDIEPPVQAILDAPKAAHRVGIGRHRADEEALFNAPGGALPTFAFHPSATAQPLPELRVRQGAKIRGDPVAANVQTTMTLVDFFRIGMGRSGLVRRLCGRELVLPRVMKRSLVAVQS